MKRGVQFGRPAKLDTEKTALAARLIAEGRSVKEVVKTFGVHKATLYRGMNGNSVDAERAKTSKGCKTLIVSP